MSNLAEIEAAAEALVPEEKQKLFFSLAAQLRGLRLQTPEPRKFSREQITGWIAEDEADMRRFQQGG